MGRLLAAAILLAGCAADGPTTGSRGAVRVAWADGASECGERCSLSIPLATGASAYLRIENRVDLPPLELRSSDPARLEIARIGVADNVFLARGLAAGRVTLLAEDDGGLLDEVSVEVRDPVQLELFDLPSEVGERWVDTFGVFRDRSSAELRGYGAATYETTEGLEVRAPNGWRAEAFFGRAGPAPWPGASSEWLELRGRASGRPETLRVRLGGGVTELSVVAAVPEILSLGLTFTYEGETAIRVAAAIVVDRPERFDPCCEWTLLDETASAYARETECLEVVLASTDVTAPQRVSVTCAYAGAVERLDAVIPAAP